VVGEGEGGFDGEGDAVVAVGEADGPAAGEGEGAEVVGGVGHEDGVGGGFEHGDVVPVVADGHDVRGCDATRGGEGEDGCALGAVGGEDVEDGEVAVGVLGAVEGEEGLGGAVEARLRKATHPFRYDWKGWATQRCAGAAGGVSGGGDAGMLEEAGLGAGHAVDGSAEHGLNGGVEGCAGCGEGVFDGVDVGDVGFVDLHPAADGGVEVFEVFDDERAASVLSVGADAVEGEDEGVAKILISLAADVVAEPEGGGVGEVGAGDELGGFGGGAEGAGDSAVGADEGEGVVQAEGAEDAHGVAMAAAGGDDDLDAGCVCGVEGGERARGDAAILVEEGAVHVDGDEAGGGHKGCCYCMGEALTVVRSTLSVGSRHWLFVDDHPVDAELVAEHGELVGVEGLLQGHEDLAAIREGGVDAFGFGGGVDVECEVGGAHGLPGHGGWDVGGHEVGVAEGDAGVEDEVDLLGREGGGAGHLAVGHAAEDFAAEVLLVVGEGLGAGAVEVEVGV